jgi:glycosyltransferase involved in cell wall biosynthesis
MRILFFSTAFPQPQEPSRNPDNLERCVALARDHDVHVITPSSWRHVGRGCPRHETVVGPRLSVSHPVFWYPPGLLRGTHAWWMWQSIRRSASRAVATFRPHAVLSYWTYPDSAVAMKLAQLAGVPCIAIVGGSDVLSIDPGVPSATADRVTRVLRGVDAIAAVSDSLKEHITALGIQADKIHVLPPAVDKRIFFPAPQEQARRHLTIPLDARVIVWVGRMVGVKALDVLLDAIADLAPAWPKLRLYLIGDGPLRRSLEAKVVASGLARHIIFAGRVAHRDLPQYYRAADVTVLPSHWEGMPNILLESHACGTPFVASDVGAIPQLANRDVDELVVPGDVRELAVAIANCMRRPPAHRGRVTCNVGGWDHMAARLSEILETARQVGSASPDDGTAISSGTTMVERSGCSWARPVA